MKFRWSKPRPQQPIFVPPVLQPDQMTDEQKARVRTAAQLEFQTSLSMRDRTMTEISTSLRWVQASLLLVNGGAAAAVLQSTDVTSSARVWGGGLFAAGVILSLLSGYVGVKLVQDVPVRLSEIGGYWISVYLDLLRSEATERDWREYSRRVAKRSVISQSIGWASLFAFAIGCVIIGSALLPMQKQWAPPKPTHLGTSGKLGHPQQPHSELYSVLR